MEDTPHLVLRISLVFEGCLKSTFLPWLGVDAGYSLRPLPLGAISKFLKLPLCLWHKVQELSDTKQVGLNTSVKSKLIKIFASLQEINVRLPLGYLETSQWKFRVVKPIRVATFRPIGRIGLSVQICESTRWVYRWLQTFILDLRAWIQVIMNDGRSVQGTSPAHWALRRRNRWALALHRR